VAGKILLTRLHFLNILCILSALPNTLHRTAGGCSDLSRKPGIYCARRACGVAALLHAYSPVPKVG